MSLRHQASFRDPSGFIFRRDEQLYRQINRRYRSDYELLKTSGLYDSLVTRNLLIPHEEVDVAPAEPAEASLVIMPDLVRFISYPFEWCPGQLRAAADATLEIQRIAIEHGMSLRDASAYNIQFHNGEPVLIDTLSFEQLKEGRPWVAYGQFCRHFLAPLALMKYVDVRLGELLRTNLDGVPLDLASRLLPRRTRFQFGLGLHIHAHAASQRRRTGRPREGDHSGGRDMSSRAMLGLVESLRSATRRLGWRPAPSMWRDYYPKKESYTDVSISHKRELVSRALTTCSPQVIWDLGANTGEFSRLCADVAQADVIALEMDASSVELNWAECQRTRRGRVLPLLNNLSNPTPSQGWAHVERGSLQDRGPADLLVALAVVHHLAVGNNVPLRSLLDWFAALAPTVIIEWIPKSDPMVQRLLSTREDIFDNYSTEGFEMAAEVYFRIISKEQIKESQRYIYVLERR